MRTSLLTTCLLLLLAGCADFDRGASVSDAGDTGVGPPRMPDGGALAPGPETSGPIEAAARGTGAAPSSESPDAAGDDYASCFDDTDNDADGLFDCDDETCATLGTCRVGSGRGCRPQPLVSIDFATCTDPSTCVPGATTFGSPSPWVASGRFHPGGEDADSGLVFADAMDLRAESLVLEGTFAQPTCDAGDLCVESVAIGVTQQATLGASSRVRPEVALQLAGARNEIQLLVGSTIVRTYAFEPATPRWAIELLPTGEVSVSNEGVVRHTLEFVPFDGAHVVLYGRNMNRAAPSPDGAALATFGSRRALCDMPSSWLARSELELELSGSGVPWSVADAATVSAVRVDAVPQIVFESTGATGESAIFAAFETSAGPTRFRSLAELTAPILEASDEPGAVAVRDPELVLDGATFHLLYTVETADTAHPRRIGHASGDDLRALTVLAPIIDPSRWPDLASVEMPTAVFTALGAWVVVVRATGIDGTEQLVAFTGPSLDSLARVRGSDLDALTQRTGAPQTPTFDADEIASPSLAIGGTTFYLYYSGRRGTRWGVGLFASEDFVHFRDVTAESGAILTGQNGQSDALGPIATDVLIEGDLVTLFYVGTDGASTSLFRTSRTGAVSTP